MKLKPFLYSAFLLLGGCSTESEPEPRLEYRRPITVLNNQEILGFVGEADAHVGWVSSVRKAARARRPVRVAVLDNGFAGIEKLLPADPKESDPLQAVRLRPSGKEAISRHGTAMIELLWLAAQQSTFITRGADSGSLQIFPIVTNGKDGFSWAVDEAIRLNVDMILHSQVYTGGTDQRGGGWVNNIVNRAIQNNILWINASGNHQRNSGIFRGLFLQAQKSSSLPIDLGQGQTEVSISLKEPSDLRLDIAHNFTLSTSGTTQDASHFPIDFCLIQDGTRVFCSQNSLKKDNVRVDMELKQMAYRTSLPAGEYSLRFFKNPFAPAQDLQGDLWFTTQLGESDALNLNSSMQTAASINVPSLSPNDNPGVITIAASDSLDSPDVTIIAGSSKPPQNFLRISSRSIFTGGIDTVSSSTAAALFAGRLARAL